MYLRLSKLFVSCPNNSQIYIDSYSIEENRQAKGELNSLNSDHVDDQMNFLYNDDDDGDGGDGENMKA